MIDTDVLEQHLPLTPLSFHILLALSDRERHGYGILKEIERQTGGAMKTASGALYLAAVRLQDAGLIAQAEDRPDSDVEDKRRRYYRLTPLGRHVAAAEAERMAKLLGCAFDTGLIRGTKPTVESS
jgi:DNA-binding PadR family transcriptional regulator